MTIPVDASFTYANGAWMCDTCGIALPLTKATFEWMSPEQTAKVMVTGKPCTVATDDELAQAYSQGYQDGRRGIQELIAALRYAARKNDGIEPGDKWTGYEAFLHVRAALAQLSPDQPATKGE